MTIRTRLNLWYAAVLCLTLLVMAGLSYNEFVVEKRQPKQAEKDSASQDMEDLVGILCVTVLPAVVLGLVGGWWLTRQALAPVAAVTRAAGRIHDRNLHEQLPRSGNGDELDQLTEVFNAMTARLHDSFQRIREFTLHASHELKTPLTVLHGEMETAMTEEPLTASQRERIASELDEVQRLAKIVDGLTLLTKADAGQIQLKRQPLQFDDIVRDVFADAQILAKPESLQVQLATCEPVTIQGDRHRLRQLLLNLVDNAIKYNAPRGLVTIALVRVHEYAELTVANTGPGIPHTALPRVFDRFYRADQAHSDTVEGCGLGLSIAQWIVSAHGGQIQIASEPDVKTSLVVRLPLHTPDAQAP